MNTTATPDKSPVTSSALIESATSRAERTQTWVADKSGIPLSTYRRKLAGHTDWTVTELARVARALGVHPASLLPDEFVVEGAAREPIAA
jgi:hypothetical protein